MNRYANETRVWMPKSDGQLVEAVVRPPYYYLNQDYLTYRAKFGDTMWSLAHQHYQDPSNYWVIADMNPRIPFPDDLTYDTVVNIPIGT